MKAQKDESPLSAFDGILSGNTNTSDSDTINMDDMIIDNDDDVVDLSIKKDAETKPSTKDKADKKSDDDDSLDDDDSDDEIEEEKEIEVQSKTKQKKNTDKSDEDDENDTKPDVAESSQVGMFFDAFSEALDWPIGEDEKKPDTIEGLIEYMKDLVEENSQMEYADDKVKELDEFIRNGGKFEDYYEPTKQLVSLDKIDLEDDDNQKLILKEHLKLNGYTDTQINKKISRWEDAGMLEDEAKDAIEPLKEHRTKVQNETIQKQAAQKLEQEKKDRQFYTDVVSTIDNLKEIRGIKIPVEDRKKLKDYAFKVEAEGVTKYQKEYSKNLAKNFIESVYFTMKGDALVKSAKQSGESSAISKLRQSMKTNKIGNSKHNMDNSSATPIWEAASSFFGSGK